MSETETEARESPIPADAGLKGRSSQAETPLRTGSGLLDATAGGAHLRQQESDDMVDFYLSNDELPDDDEVVPYDVKFGRKNPRVETWQLHPISWDDWQDARERATDDKTGNYDAFVASSWNVARGLSWPQLGPKVLGAQRDNPAKAPTDAADLLRRMFAKQSGTLLSLSAKVLEISHLQDDDSSVVEKEITAAKN